ncbi:TetR/AcrR family transcriptional regulator [Microbispora sp. KK1-11]|uniref:TetR/AcrR family transcriptional regulator n=1 Tax=Microbispora sp. KK1-11 TaxID=2053005 RepID=UPI0011584D35|nr:TetR/AcrR family transcriptional regulator [Microbispora sp. KK1-11]TQS20334.1 TetR family transcriptional regulator [Microbispora sp. KK1-11]
MTRVGRPPQDPARQVERAHRILDAAAELIGRWGYDKTTIDDVAKQAGVAKGTIYLHWRTRDTLFAALLRRERVRMLEEVRRSGPATPRELFAGIAAGLLRRPLLKAALVGDSEVLGKLIRGKRTSPGSVDLGEAFDTYYAALTAAGAARDLAGDHTLVIGSILYGFLTAPWLQPGGPPAKERLAELLGDVIERATGTGRALPEDAVRAVEQATLDYLGTVAAVARKRLADSLSSSRSV